MDVMGMEFEISLVGDPAILDGMRTTYHAALTGPVEPWLEEQTHRASYYAICSGAGMVGYACTDDESRLLQFFIDDNHARHAQALFRRLIVERLMTAAYVSTRNPFVLSLCIDLQQCVACQAYLFVDQAMIECPVTGIDDLHFRPAIRDDLPMIMAVSDDFFAPTAANIEQGKLYLLTGADEILSIGLIETDDCYPKTTAAIGMFTHPRFRRRGIGAHMIMRLKETCYAAGYTPIAGCWYQNSASKNTLERAGMVTKDRILSITF